MPRLATAGLREKRARVREALVDIAARVGELPGVAAGRRAAAMQAIVTALDEALAPHLRWEERAIHPIVDKFACEGPAAFSATMRYEHEIIYRWSAELARLASGGDPMPFARRADNLLGVLLAHFELEEQILFPILDRTLTAEALQDRLGRVSASGAAGGEHG
jgi:iron-sulfur cluster repair protein YtfE (RIC family)